MLRSSLQDSCTHTQPFQRPSLSTAAHLRGKAGSHLRDRHNESRRRERHASGMRLCTRAAVAAPEKQKQVIQLDVTKMAPLGDRLLVKPREAEKTTSGGILLTGGTTQPIQEALIGQVLAVGEDVKVEVKVGDTVIFSKYSSTDVKAPDGDISFVAEKSILARLS